MNPDPSSSRFAERAGSILLAYWMLPLTLFLFWARYLTRQEILRFFPQAALLATSIGIATYATMKVGRPHENWTTKQKWADGQIASCAALTPQSLRLGYS